jgi:hypothetical protein
MRAFLAFFCSTFIKNVRVPPAMQQIKNSGPRLRLFGDPIETTARVTIIAAIITATHLYSRNLPYPSGLNSRTSTSSYSGPQSRSLAVAFIGSELFQKRECKAFADAGSSRRGSQEFLYPSSSIIIECSARRALPFDLSARYHAQCPLFSRLQFRI